MTARATTRDAYRLFHQGAAALAGMEAAGIRVDEEYLARVTKETQDRVEELEKQLKEDKLWRDWRKRFGDKANLGSLPQLGTLLFTDMGLPCSSRTVKTGRPQVDEAALQRVDLPFVKTFVRLQKLKKVKSTYLEGLAREVVGGYVHPFFNLAGGSGNEEEGGSPVSFRSSASAPNFQNIPIRDPIQGKIIRQCFIPRHPKRRLVEVDFSGAEVRVACCYTKDPRLIEEFTGPGGDPHGDTACQLFFLKKHQVGKKTLRHTAKNMFVFPQFYGSVYFQCAPNMWEEMERRQFRVLKEGDDPGGLKATGPLVKDHLKKHGITSLGECDPKGEARPGTFEYHVRQVEKDFWDKRFRVYSQWKRDWLEAYYRRGYFDMLTGFRAQGLYGRNQVLSYAIQGSSFHCLLQTIIWTQRYLTRKKMKTLLIGQIHDSLIADVVEEELQEYLSVVKRFITTRLRRHWPWLIVDMVSEAEVTPPGGNWHQKGGWEESGGVWGPKG